MTALCSRFPPRLSLHSLLSKTKLQHSEKSGSQICQSIFSFWTSKINNTIPSQWTPSISMQPLLTVNSISLIKRYLSIFTQLVSGSTRHKLHNLSLLTTRFFSAHLTPPFTSSTFSSTTPLEQIYPATTVSLCPVSITIWVDLVKSVRKCQYLEIIWPFSIKPKNLITMDI